jgi:predicted amidophosphoribosyltransferase
MIPRLCQCCGSPMAPSINSMCPECIATIPPEPEQPEEHFQSEWKQEVANDQVILDLVWDEET